MENSILETKTELIDWINKLKDSEVLAELTKLKNKDRSCSFSSELPDDNSEKVDFDQQFAAGMTSDELMENIAAHLATMDPERPGAVVSDIQSEYAVKDDFDERFAKGLTSKELIERVYVHIDTLPWKEK